MERSSSSSDSKSGRSSSSNPPAHRIPGSQDFNFVFQHGNRIVQNNSARGKMATEQQKYLDFLKPTLDTETNKNTQTSEEERTTPLFSWSFKEELSLRQQDSLKPATGTANLSQYALLGHERVRDESAKASQAAGQVETIFLNTNAPWSAFLCGSQGSGKSHTLSCMLEGCLLSSDTIGQLPHPLTGVVFHYDTHSSGSICEAAYLSTKIRVNVLVSPSNFQTLKTLYSRLPNVAVHELKLKPKHLNVERIKDLMAVNATDRVPLYMQVIYGILREMAMTQTTTGFDFVDFQRRIMKKDFTKDQTIPLNLRLELLSSIVDTKPPSSKARKTDIFSPMPGTLTVVDLTDPFIDAATACTLFDICLALFLENKNAAGLVIALDEAHKYMCNNEAAARFAENLVTTIRVQRHVASRIIIATQEPDIDPKLLDLCSMTIIHRFTSPAWLAVLKKHIAGLSQLAGRTDEELVRLFQEIVELNVGESLLFSPSAMLRVKDGVTRKLGFECVRFKTRPRITADGGKSILANREGVGMGGVAADGGKSVLDNQEFVKRELTTVDGVRRIMPTRKRMAEGGITTDGGKNVALDPERPAFESVSGGLAGLKLG